LNFNITFCSISKVFSKSLGFFLGWIDVKGKFYSFFYIGADEWNFVHDMVIGEL